MKLFQPLHVKPYSPTSLLFPPQFFPLVKSDPTCDDCACLLPHAEAAWLHPRNEVTVKSRDSPPRQTCSSSSRLVCQLFLHQHSTLSELSVLLSLQSVTFTLSRLCFVVWPLKLLQLKKAERTKLFSSHHSINVISLLSLHFSKYWETKPALRLFVVVTKWNKTFPAQTCYCT